MGGYFDKDKPEWVTQTAREVAEEEIHAAEIHYTYWHLIEEGDMSLVRISVEHDIEHHKYWHKKHLEAAWFCYPQSIRDRGL